jgi:hypothetical protein
MKPIIILTVPHCVPLERALREEEPLERDRVPIKDYVGRLSDTNALNMANSLKNIFEKNNIEVNIIKSVQNRSILDDNRYSNEDYANMYMGRYTIKNNSKLWRELRKMINDKFNDYHLYRTNKINYQTLKNNDVTKLEDAMSLYPYIIIIDCHSFYPGGFDIDGKYKNTIFQDTGNKLVKDNVITSTFKDAGSKKTDDDVSFEEHSVVILDYEPYQKITEIISQTLNEKNIKTRLMEGAIGHNSILDVFTLHPIIIPTVLLEVREDLSLEKLNTIADIICNVVISQ